MPFDRKSELIWKIQELADASGDLDLRVGFGRPGYRIEVRNETLDTGQAWTQTSGFVDLLCAAVGALLGGQRQQYFTLLLPLSSVELTEVPAHADTLQVFVAGVLLQREVDYTWDGEMEIAFTNPTVGWVEVDYVAAVPEPED
jgi:hypothetical protein